MHIVEGGTVFETLIFISPVSSARSVRLCCPRTEAGAEFLASAGRNGMVLGQWPSGILVLGGNVDT